MENSQKSQDARLDVIREMTKRENVVDATYYFGVDCSELPIRITRSIPISTYGEMLHNIAESLWDDGDVYNPHMRRFVTRMYIYFYYTDLPMTAMDVELLCRVCQDDELYRFVTGIMIDDMGNLDHEIDELLAWEQQRKLHRSSSEMADTVTALFAHLDTMLENVEKSLATPDDHNGSMNLQSLVKAMELIASKDEGEIAKGVLTAQQERTTTKGKRRNVKKALHIEMVRPESEA